jgi:glycerate kinase
MRILIAPDKFKGSLTAQEVADQIALGLRERLPKAVIRMVPMADGGEGTADVIRDACAGEWINCSAHDALGRAIDARYVWLQDRASAVIEMSAAAGLWRIGPEERDLLRATTYGVGELMNDAATRGAKEILLGLGGSATNDGGLGMARALGFEFLGNNDGTGSSARTHDKAIQHPGDLVNLTRILSTNGERGFPKITIAADVRNPLLGPRGATRTFGPQKGGTPEQLEFLERGLERLADLAARGLGRDLRDSPGGGAAGGLGFGLMTFCNAIVKSGFEVVAEFVRLRSAIEEADIVITGEGRLDEQTLEGKAPAGVARLARELGKPIFAIVGSTGETARGNSLFDAVLVLARDGITPQESTGRAGELLQERARELAGMM